MSVTLGLDIGTTTITSVSWDVESHRVVAVHTEPNDTNITSDSDRCHGRCESDPARIMDRVYSCLAHLSSRLPRQYRPEGLAVTGQQHGMLLVDSRGKPAGPFINWIDRRGNDYLPGMHSTYVEAARHCLGPKASERTGCQLASGYMGVTLYWLSKTKSLPNKVTPCFITDYVLTHLTNRSAPVTDPTMAASGGLFNVNKNVWDCEAIEALGLSKIPFLEVLDSGTCLGGLASAVAKKTGLPEGMPVFLGLGDNQASFLSSVGNDCKSLLVNMGTGAQVTQLSKRFVYRPPLETRPAGLEGYLVVGAEAVGGRNYSLLERFFQQIARQFFDLDSGKSILDKMNDLASLVPSGSHGLRYQPTISSDPSQRDTQGAWLGVSEENCTPGHFVRAMLEGIADTLYQGGVSIVETTGVPYQHLVGSGNGLRMNRVFRDIISARFNVPLQLPIYQEEAAVGAAIVAAIKGLDGMPYSGR